MKKAIAFVLTLALIVCGAAVPSLPAYAVKSGLSNAGDHHYTMNYNEVISLMNVGWSYEGIGILLGQFVLST